MSTKQTILVMCIILYSVNQASCLKCYVCSSKSDGPCYTNPEQEEFKKDCSLENNVKTISALSEIANSALLVTRANTSAINDELPTTSDSKECYTAIGNGIEGKLIVRDCIDKSYSDDYIIQLASIANATTESIYRCNTDLCNSGTSSTPSPVPPTTNAPNSSGSLSIALLSFACSLCLILFVQL